MQMAQGVVEMQIRATGVFIYNPYNEIDQHNAFFEMDRSYFSSLPYVIHLSLSSFLSLPLFP